MKTLIALLLIAASTAGCATIVIPRTAEGMACYRECQMIGNQCIASGGSFGCAVQNRNCRLSCPGAYEEN